MLYKIVKSSIPGRAGIEFPYNPVFQAHLKKIAGNLRWKPPFWFFDDMALERVEAFAQGFFDETQYVKHTVTWDLKNDYDGPQVDGVRIVEMSRDRVYLSNRFPLKYQVIKEDLHPGGSRANPKVSGELVVEVIARRDAVITPLPTNHEIEQKG